MTSVSLKNILRCYWQSIRKWPWSFGTSFLIYGVAVIVSGVMTPLVYRWIIDIMTGTANRPDVAVLLMQTFGWLAVAIICYHVCYRIGDYLLTRSQSFILKDLIDRAFTTLTRQEHTFFMDHFAGSLVARTRRFVRSFETMCDETMYSFWFTALRLVGILVTLWFLTPGLTVVFAVWTATYLWFSFWLTRRKLPFDKREAEADSRVTGHLADTLTNHINMKIFAAKEWEQRRFQKVTRDEEQTRWKAWNFDNWIHLIQTTLVSVLEIGSMYMAIKLWLRGDISSGTVALVQIYVAGVGLNLLHIGKSLTRFMRALADASEMVEIFERVPTVIDPAHPTPLSLQHGSITLQEVTFHYPSGASVLENFSLTIPAGQKMGLVGLSGAGKSTITKLLLRFVDPQSGAILIDGQDIRTLSQDAVHRTIAYVPQEPLLFHRTLAENIAYGKPNSSQALIETAARQAHAHEFIESLPQGYKTLVGERGIKLSGGERQRVAIARAILKDAPILIFDEATSSLDTVSERYIQESLDILMRGRTTLVIAHRLSTIRKMDRIIVLEDGQIIEDGTHAKLLMKNGRYAHFWNHQTSGFIDEEE